MANEEQLAILRQGVEVWNKWREENRKIKVDLSGAKLSGVDLQGADLRSANLRETNLIEADLEEADLQWTDLVEADLDSANLREANLIGADLAGAELAGAYLVGADLEQASFVAADLIGADLSEAYLSEAYLSGANLSHASLIRANLTGANLTGANLTGANLTGTNLTGANLTYSILVQAKISNAKISKSKIYGISVWDLDGEFEDQKELIITEPRQSVITVDNIKVAQFVYLILNNKEIRDVINTLTSKTVLILGRFSIPERKKILDALRDKLREYDLIPIVFDFDRPADKDFTETIKTLAGISYFVIADVTNPKSSPLELQATVPDYQIPFVPIIQEGESPFAMMVDLQKKYPWVLPTRSYDSIETLMSALKPGIIDPAVEMRNKLRQIKAQEHPTESLKDYLDKTL